MVMTAVQRMPREYELKAWPIIFDDVLTRVKSGTPRLRSTAAGRVGFS